MAVSSLPGLRKEEKIEATPTSVIRCGFFCDKGRSEFLWHTMSLKVM